MNTTTTAPRSDAPANPWVRIGALIAAPLLAAVMLNMAPPHGMSDAGWVVCATAVIMVIWWITEAVPLPVTGLVPLIVLPALNVLPFKDVSANFGSPIVFLFLGGFLISAAMQKWHLHLRISYMVARICARSAAALLGGIMLVTCMLSMWISNTATMVMMLPIAMSLATLINSHSHGTGHAARALALGIGYAAAIGGLGSFIGTPTNALLYGHLQTYYGVTLNLGDWMLFGVPTVIGIAGTGWLLLARTDMRGLTLNPAFRGEMASELEKLGPMTTGEKRTLTILGVAVIFWLLRDYLAGLTGLGLDDSGIAIAAALALFVTPVDRKNGIFTLDWKDTSSVPWGILLFFGGSLSLSAALVATGVSGWLGDQLEMLRGVPPIVVVMVVVAMVIMASEMMSNVATISVFLPILSVLADALHVHPMLFLLPATLAASCCFMLPGGSANNAMAYSTGHVSVPMMIRRGVRLDIASLLIITLITFTLAPLALGMDFSVVPDWAVKP